MTRWEKTGISLRAHGSFTRMDVVLMNKSEMAERKEFIEGLIEDYQAELALLEERLNPTKQEAQGDE